MDTGSIWAQSNKLIKTLIIYDRYFSILPDNFYTNSIYPHSNKLIKTLVIHPRHLYILQEKFYTY